MDYHACSLPLIKAEIEGLEKQLAAEKRAHEETKHAILRAKHNAKPMPGFHFDAPWDRQRDDLIETVFIYREELMLAQAKIDLLEQEIARLKR
jgi:hypothetical protein